MREFTTEPTDRCSVAFSPNGRRILLGGDPTAVLLDIGTGNTVRRYDGWLQGSALKELEARKVMTLKGNGRWAWSVDFSPDSKRLASGFASGTAYFWDALSGAKLQQLRVGSFGWFAKYSPDGKRIFTCSSQLLDADTGAELRAFGGHRADVRAGAWSPDGQALLSGSEDGTAKLWELTSGQLLHTFTHAADVRAVAFSPDGTRILTGSIDKTAVVWDRKSGKKLFTIEPGGAVYAVAFGAEGTQILTGSTHPDAKLWDAVSGQFLGALKGHAMTVSAVAFSPDGNRILTGSYDKTAKLWDAKTGKELIRFEGHTGSLSAVAFSPDGKRIATASADYTVKVWGTTD